ncbi:hypothetical protein DEU56DRAFT_910800 [Suillus clintonianus]|uniref:uncharacterized protein n=1 Tax=Suillus clintonianus TaxID=1904413 RepID=UPI001B876B54|nr:uncharacterized protein DEU56DRAFT_910800 [Suillus clintonianus]KAG2143673.1 hypothetical protein DEU56DRAFT_910800 [Suillus clintonianus]
MPAAIVARSDIKDCTSFSPKLPQKRRWHDTRSFHRLHKPASEAGTTQAGSASPSVPTNKDHKPTNQMKSDSVSTDLSPKNITAAARQNIKTSESLPVGLRLPLARAMPVEEEVQLQVEEPENTVELSRATTMATQLEVAADDCDYDVPLYNPDSDSESDSDSDVQQFYNSEQFTPIVREVWKYLTGPTPAKSYMEFPGVGPREFELLEHAVRETGRVATKPRLTYDYNQHLLTIDMPTILHEAFFDDLKQSFTLAINNIPYNRRTIRPQIHMNYPLQVADKSMTPDMAISLTATQGPTEVVLIPFVGETALTEEWDHVFEKVESMIAEYPETILASIVLVREAKRYVCPADSSTASKTLHNRGGNDLRGKPAPLPLKTFINKRSTPRNFEQPVRIANHTWCHVQSVEYFMWLKGDKKKPIDMRNGKAEHRAHGTLVPGLHMEPVTQILDKAMEKFRDLFLEFQKKSDPTSAIDHSVLKNFVNPPFPIDWELSALGIMSAVDLTAHLRYVNWHAGRFRGKRNRDSSYEPSESEQDGNAKSRSRRSRRALKPPPPHMFQIMSMGPIASSSNLVADASTSTSSTSKPKKNTADKPKSSKGANKSRAGRSDKSRYKRRKL